jgi:predicted ribosomally synthesized peptide with nif11-like leader
MSADQFKAFQEAVLSDAGLLDKLRSATSADAVVTIANEAGFSFSIADLMSAIGSRPSEYGSLTDEELEAAAGGACNGNQTGDDYTYGACWTAICPYSYGQTGC